MFTGINVNETADYTSPNDPDKGNPTVFVIGVLKCSDNLSIMADMINADGSINMSILVKNALQIVKRGLKGLRNLGGKDYKTEEITDAMLDTLPTEVVIELATQIAQKNFTKAAEQKN